MKKIIEKPPAPAAEKQAQPYKVLQEGYVDLKEIAVVQNCRKTFNAAAMKELADNIKKVGVLQPILLRKNGEGYVLVAGERRLRAAKDAGLQEIPARVLDVTQDQAAEIQALENLHREDLGPIEEARAFKLLLDQGKYTVEALAQRVDKSKVYVYRAIALLELPKEILEKIENGIITAAHGHQILRVPAPMRKDVLDAMRGTVKKEGRECTAISLRDFIDSQIGGDLKRATWPKDVPYGGQRPCKDCPSNSVNQGDLFDGASDGRCTNKQCYGSKMAAADREGAADFQKKYPELELLPSMRKHELENKYKLTDIAPADLRNKKVQQLIKDSPKSFAIAMAKEYEWRDQTQVEVLKPTVFVRVKDQKLMLSALGKNCENAYHYGGGYSSSSESSRSSPAERRSPKEAFIDRYVDAEMFKHMLTKASPKEKTEALINDATSGYFSRGVVERLLLVGYKNAEDIRMESRTSSPERRVDLLFAVLMARSTMYWTCDTEACKAGVDVKAFKAKTKPAAEKAWLEKHLAKGAK